MEALSQLLQGSYGYLLIFQILVVTGLFVSFLWMMAQRTKTAYSSLIAMDNTAASAFASGGMTPSEYQQIKEKCAKLEEENAKANAFKAEYDSLVQKIKFLESKLLEYEILQEEIGTLSSLKVENEKLKAELQTLQREISGSKGKSVAAAAAAASAIAEVAPPPAPVPTPDPALSTVPNVDFSTAKPVPAEVKIDADPAPVMDLGAMPPPEPAPGGPPAADDGLEGLLKQIDSLTQNPK